MPNKVSQIIRSHKKILLVLPLLICLVYAPLSAKENKFSSWQADSPQIQFEKEGVDDQIGLGRVFVPMMTKSELEPSYDIYQNGEVVKQDVHTGRSVFLKPGNYTIKLGSSEISKYLIKKQITIKEQETIILPVTWTALVVRIIDKNRNFIRQPYEIYFLEDYNASLGMEYSADEDEPDERQQTWLLPAGFYKLIKYGESPKTFVNFSTVQLEQGKLTVLTIVMDSDANVFVGSGILPEQSKKLKAKHWTRYTSLDVSFNLTSNNATEESDHVYSANFIANPENNFKLDKFPYYFNSDQELSLGWNKESNQDLRVNTNSLKANAQFIYYLIESLGVYSRVRFEGAILPENYYFDSTQDSVIRIHADGTSDTLYQIDKVEIDPAIFPVNFEEGFGLSLRILNDPSRDLKLNSGFGLSQEINDDVFEQSSNIKSIFNELENVNLSGIEVSLSGDFQVTNNLTYTVDFYTLYPLDKDRKQSYRFENSLSLRLTSIFSLDYALNLEKGESKDWLVQKHNLSLSLTFISF